MSKVEWGLPWEKKVAERGHSRKVVQNSKGGKILNDLKLEYRVESKTSMDHHTLARSI